jgi:hypothetical protein
MRKKTDFKHTRGRRRFRPLKPIKISDVVEAMLHQRDYTGLEYYYCEQIRRKRSKTPEQVRRLAEHDKEEEQIRRDPKAALRAGYKSIDRGASLLLKLIRSKTFTHVTEPTEKGRAAGVKPWRWDEAIDRLTSRLTYLNGQLVRLAEENAPKACWYLWFEAKSLAEAFTRLAVRHPEEFQEVAEGSLTMPSLRGRNPKFTADAARIVDAIHLAEKHPSPDVWDNKSRVGALCHLLVASLIEKIHDARREYTWETESVERLKQFPETADQYRGVSVDDALKSRLHPKLFEHVVACARLPDWSQDAQAWWKGRVLALVKEEFQEMARNPMRNPALWEELKRGGEVKSNTEKDMRRYMEKICKNKFDQIVRRSST